MRMEHHEKRLNVTRIASLNQKHSKSDYRKWTFFVSVFITIMLIEQYLFENTVRFDF